MDEFNMEATLIIPRAKENRHAEVLAQYTEKFTKKVNAAKKTLEKMARSVDTINYNVVPQIQKKLRELDAEYEEIIEWATRYGLRVAKKAKKGK